MSNSPMRVRLAPHFAHRCAPCLAPPFACSSRLSRLLKEKKRAGGGQRPTVRPQTCTGGVPCTIISTHLTFSTNSHPSTNQPMMLSNGMTSVQGRTPATPGDKMNTSSRSLRAPRKLAKGSLLKPLSGLRFGISTLTKEEAWHCSLTSSYWNFLSTNR